MFITHKCVCGRKGSAATIEIESENLVSKYASMFIIEAFEDLGWILIGKSLECPRCKEEYGQEIIAEEHDKEEILKTQERDLLQFATSYVMKN